MTEIPFTKLHGAENDFILTWADQVTGEKLAEIARRICARTTGIGADGWMLVRSENGTLTTRLFNSDGSEAEISGNGTRCAAALGVYRQVVSGPEVVVRTGAGAKRLHLLSQDGLCFQFEMDMGLPRTEELHARVSAAGAEHDAVILNVGNPQCAVLVEELPENWRIVARQIEGHPRFPQRTNVSFVTVIDLHTIEAVFYERGAGETRSSGTGSTGAGAAAILRGKAQSPVEIRTPAGSLQLRWDDSMYLTGPAEVIGEGKFFFEL